MSFLISNAWANTAIPGVGPNLLQQFMAGPFFIVFIFVVFYLLMIRPQMKRAKEHKQMLASIAKGDEVVTSGGMVGKVREIGENLVVLEIANQVEVRVQKPSVTSVLPKGTMTSL